MFEGRDDKRPSSNLIASINFNNMPNDRVLRKKLCNRDVALIRLSDIVGQKVEQNHVVSNIQHPGRKKYVPCCFFNAALKFIMDFATSKKKVIATHNSSHIIFKVIQILNFCSAIGRPSCRVTHHINRRASIHATFLTY